MTTIIKYPEPLTDTSQCDLSKDVVLVACDGVKYKVSREAIAKESNLIKGMLPPPEDVASEVIEIPVSTASAETLKYVVTFIEHNLLDPMPTIEKPLRHFLPEILDDWHKAYVYTDLVKGGDERQHQNLIAVMSTACFLECKDLQELTCAAAASLIRLKDRVMVREKLFGLSGDFTEAEWNDVKRNHEWCFQEQPAPPAAKE